MSRQEGNVMVLVVFQSVAVILLSLLALDIFSILYTRRAAQTAADAAAMGALRVIQPLVAEQLWKETQAKVERLFEEAKEEYLKVWAAWDDARDAAATDCESAATDEEGNVDAELLTACVDSWLDSHSAPELEDFERRRLEENISDPEIVDALMGEDVEFTAEQAIKFVLTSQEKSCVLWDIRSQTESWAATEAGKYADANGAELVDLQIPYRDKPQVFVRVERTIPTVYLERVSGQRFTASGVAAATVSLMRDAEVEFGGC